MTDPAYIELRAHSAYSLLRGTTPPESLVAEAARLGLPGLALTDHNNVYGAVSFQKAAQALGIQAILGAELTVKSEPAEKEAPWSTPPPSPLPESSERGSANADVVMCGSSSSKSHPSPLIRDASPVWRGTEGAQAGDGVENSALTLLVADETGWENLCWLITQAQHQAPKGEGLLHFEQLEGAYCRADRALRRARGRGGARPRKRRHRRRPASRGAVCRLLRPRRLLHRAAPSPPPL